MKLQEKLKYLRTESGLTQYQLAKKLGVGQTTVAAYENGTHEPQLYSLIAYADFFGCSLDYLTGRTEDAGMFCAETYAPPKDEQKLIAAYRALNDDLKKLLQDTAAAFGRSPLNKKSGADESSKEIRFEQQSIE